MALGSKLSSSQRAKARKTPVHGAVDKVIKEATGFFGGKPKYTSSTKSKPRKTASQQVAENRAKAEADAKAQGYSRTPKGRYVPTDMYEAAQQAAKSKVPAKPTIGNAMKTLGVKPKKSKVKNQKSAKKRVQRKAKSKK